MKNGKMFLGALAASLAMVGHATASQHSNSQVEASPNGYTDWLADLTTPLLVAFAEYRLAANGDDGVDGDDGEDGGGNGDDGADGDDGDDGGDDGGYGGDDGEDGDDGDGHQGGQTAAASVPTDIYDKPGGVGDVIGILFPKAGKRPIECRDDQWCKIPEGWVWGGDMDL